jgi:putative hydrolase of the HAD superfamily
MNSLQKFPGKTMKDLYIFDMGGVMSSNTNVLPDVAEYLGLSLDELHGWTREFGRNLMEGTLATEDFWQIFSQRSGIDVTEDLFSKFFFPALNHDMVALVTRLKHHHRVVCGTNTIASHYQHHLEHNDYAVFEAVYASHIMGIAKPHVEFYQYILTQEQVSASQTVFIDDAQKNVEAARQLGIRSIHFVGYESLVTTLQSSK